MKTHFFYIACILVCAAIIFYMDKRLARVEREASSYASALVEKEAEVTYYRNERGRIIAQKEAAVLTSQEIAKAYPKVIEEMKKEFDIKLKDMKAYVRNEFEARGSGNSTIHNHYVIDSTGRRVPVWEMRVSDGYLDFRSTVIDSLHAPYTYSYTDTATTVISRKKKWLFGKESLYSSTMFRNPNAKVTGTTNILVNNYKDKRWVISIGASYVPFSESGKFQPTITAGYALFKF